MKQLRAIFATLLLLPACGSMNSTLSPTVPTLGLVSWDAETQEATVDLHNTTKYSLKYLAPFFVFSTTRSADSTGDTNPTGTTVRAFTFVMLGPGESVRLTTAKAETGRYIGVAVILLNPHAGKTRLMRIWTNRRTNDA